MSRRDYPVADLYEERERDFYRSGRRGTREYAELDDDIRTTRTPDFLREDYGRSSAAGALVVRGHAHASDRGTEVDVDTARYARSARDSPPRPRTREIEKEEIIIRDNRERAAPRRREQSVTIDEFSTRRSVPDLRARPRRVEKEEIDIDIRRDSDARSVRSTRPREVEKEEIDIDIRRRDEDTRSVRSRRPREVEREEIDIDIRRDSDARSVRSTRPRNFEQEDITIRRSETVPERPPPPRIGRGSEEEITIRRGEGSRPPPPRPREIEKTEIDITSTERRGPRSRRGDFTEREEIDITRETRGRGHSPSRERERITIRESSRGPPPRERSLPPPNLLRRETEEFVIRRRRPSPSPSPSPPPPRMREETQEIIIRRTERSPTPPPPPEPEPLPPPPVLAPITRPPIYQEIHQEIITHHRHIDHGVERAHSPSPPPPMREPTPPPPVEKFESLEIDIRRRDGGKGREEDIEITQTRGRERSRSPSIVSRARSMDAPRRRHYDDDLESEAEYYNRKALERGYPGEAYNGATRDWALVDVPPGTERVRMDGAGGGAQEISWQRYNGARRSKFIVGDREFDTQYGLPAPAAAPVEDRRVGSVKSKPADMWTEVTKDLVLKEAIEHMGYDYEETEYFFYVMEYLKYEDVLQLVEISDDIRKARRRRIREIEWERETLERPSPRGDDEGRYYEREIIIDKRERRH